MGSVTYVILPRRFSYTGDITIGRSLPETDATDTEETHVSVTTATEVTSVVNTSRKLRLSSCRVVAEVLIHFLFLLMLYRSSSHNSGKLKVESGKLLSILGGIRIIFRLR